MSNNSSAFENNLLIKRCHTFNYEFKMVGEFPSNIYYANHVVLCFFNSLGAILTIVLNLATIITFRYSNQLGKKPYYFLIFVQSLNDLGIGVIVSTLFSTVVAGQLVGRTNCEIHFAFYLAFFVTYGFSMAILSAMNIERYLSIISPIYHRNKVTKRRLLIFITCCCSLFLCIAVCSLPVSQKMLFLCWAFIFLLHFINTVWIYAKISQALKTRFKRSEPTPTTHDGAARQKNISVEDCHNQRSENQGRSSDDQGRSSNIQARTVANGEGSSDGKNNLLDNQASLYNQERSSDDQFIPLGDQKRSSGWKSKSLNDLGISLKNEDIAINNQEISTDNPGRSQDNEERSSNNKEDKSSNRRYDSNKRGNSLPYQGRNLNSSTKMKASNKNLSDIHFLMKFKLAKSCFIVVMCSAVTFLLPVMFQLLRIELNDFNEIIFNGWCTFLILLNPSLDSLVFFWRNAMLRNEAMKVLRNICSWFSELVHAAVHDNQNNLFARNFPKVLMPIIHAELMKKSVKVSTGPKHVAVANKIK